MTYIFVYIENQNMTILEAWKMIYIYRKLILKN